MRHIINKAFNTATSRTVTPAISALFYRQARKVKKVIEVKYGLIPETEEFVRWGQ